MRKPSVPRRYRWLTLAASMLVPRRLRADWRGEWTAEIAHRWVRLEEFRGQTRRPESELLRRSLGAFVDAAWLCLDELRQRLRGSATRAPGPHAFATGACLTIAAGLLLWLGVCGAARAVLVRPLPFDAAARIVSVFENGYLDARLGLSAEQLSVWQRWNPSVENLAAYRWQKVRLFAARGGHRQVLMGARVSANFFAALGTRPLLGRVFEAEDFAPDAPRSIVVSHDFWRRHLDGDRDAVGRVFETGGERLAVIGVLPPDFWFLTREAQVWMPLAQITPDPAWPVRAHAIARLKRGLGVEQAEADLRTSASLLGLRGGRWIRLAGLADDMQQNVRPALLVLYVIFGVVIALACANVLFLLAAGSPMRFTWAGIGYWSFFAGKTLVLLFAAGGLALWLADPASQAPATGWRGFLTVLLSVWVLFLMSALVLWVSLIDQRSRCRVCLRRLQMPVRSGSWSSLLFDRPGIETICAYGHGKLYQPGTPLVDWRSEQWTFHGDVWDELMLPGPH